AAVDLTAHLGRVDDHTGVGGVHAVEDADLTGDPVDRDAEAVRVRRDAARRAVCLARLGEPDTAGAAGLDEFGQRHAGATAHDPVVIHRAVGDVHAGVDGR